MARIGQRATARTGRRQPTVDRDRPSLVAAFDAYDVQARRGRPGCRCFHPTLLPHTVPRRYLRERLVGAPNPPPLAPRTNQTLLSETYTALNNDLRILAAIGARTAFDHSSEKLGVDASLPFNKKLDELLKLGKISSDERQTLEVLVEAGSAAAHRGWRPKPAEINTMMDLLEAFLHRAFVLGDGIKTLKAAVPPRQARKKS